MESRIDEQASAPNPSRTQTEVLLKEYELCVSDAQHLEDMIWTTAGIFFTASVAGISLLGISISSNARIYDYLLRVGISVLSVVLVFCWRVVAARWYALQRTIYYRSVEIESMLGMYKDRYIVYLDKASDVSPIHETPHIKAMVATLGSTHRPPRVRRMIGIISWSVMLGWLLFLGFQLAAMFQFI